MRKCNEKSQSVLLCIHTLCSFSWALTLCGVCVFVCLYARFNRQQKRQNSQMKMTATTSKIGWQIHECVLPTTATHSNSESGKLNSKWANENTCEQENEAETKWAKRTHEEWAVEIVSVSVKTWLMWQRELFCLLPKICFNREHNNDVVDYICFPFVFGSTVCPKWMLSNMNWCRDASAHMNSQNQHANSYAADFLDKLFLIRNFWRHRREDLFEWSEQMNFVSVWNIFINWRCMKCVFSSECACAISRDVREWTRCDWTMTECTFIQKKEKKHTQTNKMNSRTTRATANGITIAHFEIIKRAIRYEMVSNEMKMKRMKENDQF